MEEKKRTLTDREKQRKTRFNAVKTSLEAQGYRSQELLITITQANVQGVLMTLPFVVLVVGLFVLCQEGDLMDLLWDSISLLDSLLFLPLLLVLIVAHEAIHGLIWGLFAKHHWKYIEFGVMWKQLTPYCACGEPMSKGQYTVGALMPMAILGVGLGLVAIPLHSVLLCWLGVIMTISGGGDILIVWQLLRHRTTGTELLCCDHPYEVGLVVFER